MLSLKLFLHMLLFLAIALIFLVLIFLILISRDLFKVLNRNVGSLKNTLLIIGSVVVIFIVSVFLFLPSYRSKNKILSYLNRNYKLSYWEFTILEASDGEWSIFDLGGKAGAFAFKSTAPIAINSKQDCQLEHIIFSTHLKSEGPRKVEEFSDLSAFENEVKRWRCAEHHIGKFHSYSIAHDPDRDVYFLFYQWSTG